MKIENIEISKLKPYEKNAKAHPKSQVEAIDRIIARWELFTKKKAKKL